MSDAPENYLLDANVFIQAKRRFYPFDVCPGYWDSLCWHRVAGRVCSVDKVHGELERGADSLCLLIGVTDAGQPNGLKVADELLQNLAALRSDGNIQPLPALAVARFCLPDGEIAVVEV